MRRILLVLAVTAASIVWTAPQAGAAVDPRQLKVTWTRAVGGVVEPLAMANAPRDGRLFVAERSGRIRIVRAGALKSTPFLDIRSLVNTSGEGGLLGVAFPPDYKTSLRFYVAFTDTNMTLRVRRYRTSSSTIDVASPNGTDVISIPHPGQTNHNGGQIAFGPGGYLFVGTGDGGGGGDPNGNAQNINSLLGKILRIDVVHYTRTNTSSYSVPSTNPYAGPKAGRGEIWASGLRNPWRFSFDVGNYASNLYVGDVGQGAREEVDRFAGAGRNLGWDCREGTVDTASQYGGSYCKSTGYLAPLHEYDHSGGRCAIIGGYVYRGLKYRSLADGEYLFGDYCSGNLYLMGSDSAGRRVVGDVGVFPSNILAFGRDFANELYLLAGDGVYRLAISRR